ncbi:putative serine-rich protein [Cucumis melo var. makuwa]|uniref:Serine-rich protein n=2 Tax=Cucumis melo TaxID=3656 RepID=A0A9I9DCW5_CUCME|nr:putative serine-rich protein [Cucumis melo var. makuwa]
MASACVNNVGISSENFLDCSSSVPCHSYGWLGPRLSFSRDDSPPSNLVGPLSKTKPAAGESETRDPDPELVPVSEFEFRLQDPVSLMLPADELFFDGKLVPLQVSSAKPSVNGLKSTRCVSSPETTVQSRRRVEEECSTDPYLFSPKAPRCSSRWRELLGLKKLYQSSSNGNGNGSGSGNGNGSAKNENHKTTTTSSSSYFSEANSKALKYFLHRSSKSSLSSSLDSSLSLPLLKDSDSESVSLSSSRVSLSSSSSGHEHEDLHRLSLDCENKPNTNPISLHRNPNHNNPPRMRLVKPRPKSESNPRSTSTADHPHPSATRVGRSPIRRTPGESSSSSSRLGIRGVSVDSPRMNSSGKIVFHNLERSSSSPSSFNGGPKFKNRGMERSYSANVRVTPVLNVPVCSSLRGSSKSVSVFGFGPLLFTGNGGSSRNHQNSSSNSSSSSNRTTTRRITDTEGGGKIHW